MIYQNEILGGLQIGLASALPLLLEGRLAGVSGLAASGLRPKTSEGRTGLIFVIGINVGGLAWRFSGGHLPNPDGLVLSMGLWLTAGLLVGFGSRMAGGCTSGHGVCGLGRMSKRSLLSVAVFVFFAMVTTYLIGAVL